MSHYGSLYNRKAEPGSTTSPRRQAAAHPKDLPVRQSRATVGDAPLGCTVFIQSDSELRRSASPTNRPPSHVARSLTPASPARSRKGRTSRRTKGASTKGLDGVDRLPLGAQSSLLRVIDDPSSRARRDASWQPQGVRLVSISNAPSSDLAQSGGFLEPLRMVLSVAEVQMPNLRDRQGDLYVLVSHLLRELTPPARGIPRLTSEAWRALSTYKFPGKVRELVRAIEHALTVARGDEIDRQHFPEEVARKVPT